VRAEEGSQGWGVFTAIPRKRGNGGEEKGMPAASVLFTESLNRSVRGRISDARKMTSDEKSNQFTEHKQIERNKRAKNRTMKVLRVDDTKKFADP